jgi:transcriptional regulator with XRE-family HTH domain
MKLYDNIKKRRQELEMSQDELAKLLGYKSRSTIAKIESGENDLTQTKIADFARALRTTPGELMGLSNDEGNNEDTILVLDDEDIRMLARKSDLNNNPTKCRLWACISGDKPHG